MPSKGPKLIFIELFLLVGIYITILSVAEVTYASAFGRNYQSLMSNNEQIKIFTKNAGAEHPYNIKSGSNNSPSSIIKSTLGIFDSVVKGKLTATANFFTSEKKQKKDTKKVDEVDARVAVTSQNPSQILGEEPSTRTTVTLVTKSPPIDLPHKPQTVEGFSGKTKPATFAYTDVREERERASTTKSPTGLIDAVSLMTVMEASPMTPEPDNNKDPNSDSDPNS